MKILHPSLWFVLFWLSLDCVAQQKLPIAYRAGDNPDRCSGSQLYELIAKFAKGEATKKDLQSELKWMADSCESAKGGGLKPKQIPTPKPTPTPAPTPTPPPNPDSGEAVGYKNNPPDIVVAHGAEHQLQPGQYLSLEGLADQYVIRHVCIHSKGEEPTRNDVVFNIPMPGLGSFQRSTVINYVPVIYSKANYLGASKNFWNLYWNWTECNYITCGKIVNPALKNGGKPFCNNHKWSGVGCANFKNYDKADFESDFAALVFGSEKVEVAKSSNSSPVKTNIPTDWFRDYPEPEKDSHEKNMQYLLLNIASYLARCPTLKYMTSANGSIGEPSMGKIVLYNSGTTDPFIVFIDNYSIIHNPVDSDFLTDDAIELLVKEGLNSGVPSGFLKECVDEFFRGGKAIIMGCLPETFCAKDFPNPLAYVQKANAYLSSGRFNSSAVASSRILIKMNGSYKVWSNGKFIALNWFTTPNLDSDYGLRVLAISKINDVQLLQTAFEAGNYAKCIHVLVLSNPDNVYFLMSDYSDFGLCYSRSGQNGDNGTSLTNVGDCKEYFSGEYKWESKSFQEMLKLKTKNQ